MNIVDCEQGTPEWFAARLGKVTASKVADVVAKTKSGYAASRANYAAQLVAERLTGTVAESYSNGAMQWGADHEPEARALYEMLHDVEVIEIGFAVHPTIKDAGASPDGLVGDDGMVEFKCPNIATHIDTLLSKTVPGKYLTQMQWQMATCDRQWCDFVSYDPRLPGHMRMFVQRVHRDDARIRELETEVVSFIGDVVTTVERLNALYEEAA